MLFLSIVTDRIDVQNGDCEGYSTVDCQSPAAVPKTCRLQTSPSESCSIEVLNWEWAGWRERGYVLVEVRFATCHFTPRVRSECLDGLMDGRPHALLSELTELLQDDRSGGGLTSSTPSYISMAKCDLSIKKRSRRAPSVNGYNRGTALRRSILRRRSMCCLRVAVCRTALGTPRHAPARPGTPRHGCLIDHRWAPPHLPSYRIRRGGLGMRSVPEVE